MTQDDYFAQIKARIEATLAAINAKTDRALALQWHDNWSGRVRLVDDDGGPVSGYMKRWTMEERLEMIAKVIGA